MKVFDRIEQKDLDRREVQLWVLALTTLAVLAAGMALLMYPTVFKDPIVLSGITFRKIFFGFCALSALLLGYLLDRQIVIRNLRRLLLEEQKRIIRIRHEASSDLLNTLPGIDHFRDRLAMEYRRASGTKQPLSLLLVELKSSRELKDTSEVATAFGDAAMTMTRKLRGEDSIYHFRDGIFAIVLPGVACESAYRVSSRLDEGLRDASGASDRFSSKIRVVNFPDHAASAREMEESVLSIVPGRLSTGAVQ